MKVPNRSTLSTKRKILMTLLILIILRAFSSIPTPFTNAEYLEAIIAENGTFSLLDSMTGGGLSSLSIMTLSITPYITASIIIQLLGVAFPKIHEMQRGMDDDRKKIDKLTILLGAGLAAGESIAMAVGYGKQGMLDPYQWYSVATCAACWTMGALFSSLAGKLITDRYFGNGTSYILLINILSSYVPDLKTTFEMFLSGETVPYKVLYGAIICICLIVMFAFITLVQTSEKKISVIYSRKMSDRAFTQRHEIPIKLLPGSSAPIIFASSILTIPTMICTILGDTPKWTYFFNSSYWFSSAKPVYTIGSLAYALMIVGFSFFYDAIVFNPAEVADNLQKGGGVIAGIRPGKPTADYLKETSRVCVLAGGLALMIVALIPIIVSAVTGLSDTAFMGTSIVITAAVLCEIRSQVLAEKRGASYKMGSLFGTNV